MSRRCSDCYPPELPIYLLLIARLDLAQDYYSTAEIGALLGIGAGRVAQLIREYNQRGNQRGNRHGQREPRAVHRLGFREAVLLVRRFCRDGRRLPDREQLYQELRKQGIAPMGLKEHPSVRAAVVIFEAERQAMYAKISKCAPREAFKSAL